jgi:hypothetical protein
MTSPTWDIIAAEEGARLVFRNARLATAYASLVVPAKRFMFPPYSFAANYYFPEAGSSQHPDRSQKK